MAKQRFRGALNAAQFPLVSILQARTVVQPQLDNNVRTARSFYGTDESADYSIPQLMYCQDVVPTAEGLQSIGYNTVIDPIIGAVDFDQAITLRDEDENNFIFSPANGKNYIFNGNIGVWESVNPIVGWTGKLVTRAYVNGRTFFCYEGYGIYEYDGVTNTITKQVVIGLSDSDIRGIGNSSNYLLAFGDLTVYWSSLVNPLDFVPSLITGAGFAIPQDVKARITAIVGISGGFIVYTAKNAVAAVFTNNTRAPFTFKEVNNAGGILTYEQVTSEQNSGPHYAWTTGGLQKITIQGAEPVSGEVNDFIAGRIYETWDPTTKILTQFQDSAAEFPVKITYIASRFLIVSYATGSSEQFNYALFYDTILKRWGKLKIDHVDCFAYPYPNVFGDLSWDDLGDTTWDELEDTTWAELAFGIISDPPSKLTVSFLQQDGTVKILQMDYNKIEQQLGVAIFGKFQLIRAKMMTLQVADFEGVYDSGATSFTMTAISTIDGKNVRQVVPMVTLYEEPKLIRYAKRLSGMNFWLVAEGTFALSTYVMEVTMDGDR